MFKRKRIVACGESWIGVFGSTLGKGLLAGAIGTVAISLSQAIEMKISGRGPSSTPRQAAEKVFGITARDERASERLNTLVHYGYGTSLGLIRGLLSLSGLRGLAATAVHTAKVQALAMILLPRLGLAPPVRQWGRKALATEILHHAVYGVAAGRAFDWMNRGRNA